ncbi:conjugal transfer protein TrbL [Actinotalea ferrariae CF5-4]|uniref:Conjugal transfer protein TrbL n=1 Tax=Actinotalea ferrariae CF5-4 TaxID=948458 RepID=A0A021VVK6_9CELL|nr:type IV secretion system protein [Actinotalea ferrariae]EYR65224.1 conjugal transfer protein TrbL [Actinotalea ferrariae CF5-4]
MPTPALDPCVGPITFLCDLASNAAGSAAAGASDYVLSGLGAAFVDAAAQIGTGALTALDTLTPIDLSVSWLRDNVAVIATITLPVLVALFALQVIGSVLRREPGGLGRAVGGVGKALLGAALALGVTQVALTAVDELCEYVAASAGTTVAASAGQFFNFAAPVLATSPGLAILFGLAMMIGFLLLWGVLLFRKAALILIAVLAPIAFAGSAWDQTRVWTRRWLEIVAALVFSKLVIVVVFVVGASAFSGVGPSTSTSNASEPPGVAGLSDLLVGLLLLSIAVFAPWLTWRFVHWSGMEAAAVMNSAVAAGPITRGARSAGAQTRGLAQHAATTMLLGHVGAAGAAGKAASAGKAAGGGATTNPVRPSAPPAATTAGAARPASAPPRGLGGGRS